MCPVHRSVPWNVRLRQLRTQEICYPLLSFIIPVGSGETGTGGPQKYSHPGSGRVGTSQQVPACGDLEAQEPSQSGSLPRAWGTLINIAAP